MLVAWQCNPRFLTELMVKVHSLHSAYQLLESQGISPMQHQIRQDYVGTEFHDGQ